MKNENIAGLEEGRTDPIRLGLNHLLRLQAKYPSDDVRYVPTLDEQTRADQEALPRSGPQPLSRVPRCRSRRARGRRRLRALRDPADPGQDARGVEGREAVRPDRTPDPARHQGRERRRSRPPTRPTRSTWRGFRPRSRTAIPTIRIWLPAIISWEAVPSPRGSPIDSVRRGDSPIRRCRCSPPIPSSRTRP